MSEFPNGRIESLVREIAAMLARGEYSALADLSGGTRLSAAELATAVRDYPATLTDPPRGSEPPIDVVEISDTTPRAWSVDVPMWSREEGRSDLTLQLTVIELPTGGYRVEIDDVHVL